MWNVSLLVRLTSWSPVQNPIEAMLACHPAPLQATKWLDWVAKWCELHVFAQAPFCLCVVVHKPMWPIRITSLYRENSTEAISACHPALSTQKIGLGGKIVNYDIFAQAPSVLSSLVSTRKPGRLHSKQTHASCREISKKFKKKKVIVLAEKKKPYMEIWQGVQIYSKEKKNKRKKNEQRRRKNGWHIYKKIPPGDLVRRNVTTQQICFVSEAELGECHQGWLTV